MSEKTLAERIAEAERAGADILVDYAKSPGALNEMKCAFIGEKIAALSAAGYLDLDPELTRLAKAVAELPRDCAWGAWTTAFDAYRAAKAEREREARPRWTYGRGGASQFAVWWIECRGSSAFTMPSTVPESAVIACVEALEKASREALNRESDNG